MTHNFLFAMMIQAIIILKPSSSQSDFCIWGRSGHNFAINGLYKHQGIWNTYPYYKRDTEEGSGSPNVLYVFWSATSTQLLIHSSLDDQGDCCYARCTLFDTAHHPSECDNSWQVWDGSAMNLDSNVHTIADSCPNFCMWGRMDFPNKAINGLYQYGGIWNEHPYYKQLDSGGKECLVFYIFWSETYTRLIIHTSLDDQDSGGCCYARCTLFDDAHNPNECDNAWQVWDGSAWDSDSNVYSAIDACPSWQCDEVSIPSLCNHTACGINGCEGPFDEYIAPNVWKKNKGPYWYFVPHDWTWVCAEKYPPDCDGSLSTVIGAGVAYGQPWTDLSGGSINLDFVCPDTESYTVNCINYPTENPTSHPTHSPSRNPSSSPTPIPTSVPTSGPSIDPSSFPTISPTYGPTTEPTYIPTDDPTSNPLKTPTVSKPTTSDPITIEAEIQDDGVFGDVEVTFKNTNDKPTEGDQRNEPITSVVVILVAFIAAVIMILATIHCIKRRKSLQNNQKMIQKDQVAEDDIVNHVTQNDAGESSESLNIEGETHVSDDKPSEHNADRTTEAQGENMVFNVSEVMKGSVMVTKGKKEEHVVDDTEKSSDESDLWQHPEQETNFDRDDVLAEVFAMDMNDLAHSQSEVVQQEHNDNVYWFVFETKPFGMIFGKMTGDKKNLYVTSID
eukprot:566247_1